MFFELSLQDHNHHFESVCKLYTHIINIIKLRRQMHFLFTIILLQKQTLKSSNFSQIALINTAMSKKKSKDSGVSKKVETDVSYANEDKNGNILLKILAKPGAKLNSITDLSPNGIGVQINAPPVEGEANVELIKYVSDILGIRKTNVSLEKGSRSRQKVLLIDKGSIDINVLKTKITNELSNKS